MSDTKLSSALTRCRARKSGEETPVPLPFGSLADKLNGGLWPGVHFLVGGTGSGKTQLALQCCLHAASAGVPALYVGLELDHEEVVTRVVGLLSGERWSRLLYAKAPMAVIGKAFDRASDVLAQVPLRLESCDAMRWTSEDLLGRVADMRAVHPTGPLLVVVDYLQVLQSPPGERQDLRERIGRASYAARNAARKHDAAVLVLSSTARENYKRISEAKSPGELVGTGKESGEVEYSADSVMVLCPDAESNRTRLALAKVRAGCVAWADLEFDGGRFSEPLHLQGEDVK